MQVAKWGNSLAVRLPTAVVQALKLKEGDNIEVAGGAPFRDQEGTHSSREGIRAYNRLFVKTDPGI